MSSKLHQDTSIDGFSSKQKLSHQCNRNCYMCNTIGSIIKRKNSKVWAETTIVSISIDNNPSS